MDAPFWPARRGTIFESHSGKLRRFWPDRILVMRAWPPWAWEKSRSHPRWAHVRPKISVPSRGVEERVARLYADVHGQLLLPFCREERPEDRLGDMAWARWYAQIPEGVRKVVAEFPPERQWSLLSFLARGGNAAMEIARSNPALAWVLASNTVFHRPRVRRPLRSARALLKPGRSQRDILAWCGFVASEPVRRIMRKINPKSCSLTPLLHLRERLTDPTVCRALSHLPRINRSAISIAASPELLPKVSPALLEEISLNRKDDRYPRTAHLLKDSLNTTRWLGLQFPHLRSIAQMRELHHELSAATGGWLLDHDLRLPPPPIRGTAEIVPLTSVRSMTAETVEMRNCVASLAKDVAISRNVYAYATVPPLERCTLAIAKRGETWVLSELKRKHNQEPSGETRRAVLRWLSEAQTTGLSVRCPDVTTRAGDESDLADEEPPEGVASVETE